ncbi:hypothetical protein SD78_1799 [Bacillus badius]|nr:hypothetical protein SD78_1799 [Bacillus badius]
MEGDKQLRNAKVVAEIKRIKEDMTRGIFIDAMDMLNKYIKIGASTLT